MGENWLDEKQGVGRKVTGTRPLCRGRAWHVGVSFGAWGGCKEEGGRRMVWTDGGWCGRTEGMAGGPESADEGPCTIPLSKSLGKILSGGVT